MDASCACKQERRDLRVTLHKFPCVCVCYNFGMLQTCWQGRHSQKNQPVRCAYRVQMIELIECGSWHRKSWILDIIQKKIYLFLTALSSLLHVKWYILAKCLVKTPEIAPLNSSCVPHGTAATTTPEGDFDSPGHQLGQAPQPIKRHWKVTSNIEISKIKTCFGDINIMATTVTRRTYG